MKRRKWLHSRPSHKLVLNQLRSAKPNRSGYVLLEGELRNLTATSVEVLGFRAPLSLHLLLACGGAIYIEAKHLSERK